MDSGGCLAYPYMELQGFAIGVVGVGGEAEADYAFISFFGYGIELRQSG